MFASIYDSMIVNIENNSGKTLDTIIPSISFQYRLCRNFAIGGFRDHDALRAFDHVVGNDHVTADRQTMHEISIVGQRHLSVSTVQARSLLNTWP